MNRPKTPYFVLDRQRLDANLQKLSTLAEKANIKILHTLKSFNQESVLPTISTALSGMSVSSQEEITMAIASNAQHLHLYAPALSSDLIERFNNQIQTLSLNSLSQWQHLSMVKFHGSLGLRINPKLNLPIPSYCNPNLSAGRLGVDYEKFLQSYHTNPKAFNKLEGLHLHALFQSSVEGLYILLDHLNQHYQEILPKLKWLNLGGGHNFTDNTYDTQKFITLIDKFKSQYPQLDLYFEPGEAVISKTGEFVTTVLDIIDHIVILNTSIETHLLDVAIVNKRLKIKGASTIATPYYYELTGNSCLQGDYIGEYFFKEPLKIGERVIFEDMMGYTMVKMTQFNGMKPADFTII
jgi:carboxynorspermidine decarboxylase